MYISQGLLITIYYHLGCIFVFRISKLLNSFVGKFDSQKTVFSKIHVTYVTKHSSNYCIYTIHNINGLTGLLMTLYHVEYMCSMYQITTTVGKIRQPVEGPKIYTHCQHVSYVTIIFFSTIMSQ